MGRRKRGRPEKPVRAKTVEQQALERRQAEAALRQDAERAADRAEGPAVREERKGVKKAYQHPRGFRIGGWCAAVVLVLVLAFLFANAFCHSVVINEGSMEPTLSAGQTCLMNEVVYRMSRPKRGDIIVFRSGNGRLGEGLRVKRIVGLPGETVQIRDGRVLINGSVVDGNYASIVDPGLASEPVVLGSDEYFVLGDNRNGSEDSRYEAVGNVAESDIVGKLWLRIRPFRKVSFIG
ncbi:MAG: signal peptidase I [Bilifractor sp.]|nr:signal peptidase I [Lachnospiraceae bacterium]MDY2837994.1 signal peptidase I [Bilifractor sp.]